jgi:hypothetical protein
MTIGGAEPMSLDRDGAELARGAATPHLSRLVGVLAGLPRDQAGIRIQGLDALRPILPIGP